LVADEHLTKKGQEAFSSEKDLSRTGRVEAGVHWDGGVLEKKKAGGGQRN